MLESSGRKDNVRRRVQCGLGRILQYTDHKTDSHHLHSDVLVNTEQSAGERNQQERAAGNAGSTASANRCNNGKKQCRQNIDLNT